MKPQPPAGQIDWQDKAAQPRPRGGQVGITRKVQRLIVRATSLIASGMKWEETANALGVTLVALKDWQFRHPGLWKSHYDAAMRATVEAVQATAGTDAVLADVPAFFAAASRAERWVRKRGESLFPHNGEMTLTRFYEEVYKPLRLNEARKSTLYLHGIILRHWAMLTGDPPLKDVTSLVLARFRDCCQQLCGIKTYRRAAGSTVHSKMSLVQAILDKAGQPCRFNRDAVGMLERVPWIRPPKKSFRQPRIVPAEQIEAVYLATAGMDIPLVDGIKAPAWWRALLVTTYCTGLRRGTLFALEMRDIDWPAATRVFVPAEKMKTRMPLVAPLPATASQHLRLIRTDRKRVFPWPYRLEWLNECFHRLQDSAGIPREDHFGLHNLRKTLATLLWEHSPAAAQLALGHTSGQTTQQYYVQAAEIVARAVDALPMPGVFRTFDATKETDAA